MFQFYIQSGGARRKPIKIVGDHCYIGSARHNDVVLDRRGVAKRHAELFIQDNCLFIEDLGSTSGTWVNRERVREYGPLAELDEIVIGDTYLWVDAASIRGAVPAIKAGDQNTLIAEDVRQGSDIPAYQTTGPSLLPTDSDDTEVSARVALERVSEDSQITSDLRYWGRIIHQQLLEQMDLRRKDVNRMSDDVLKRETRHLLDEIVARYAKDLPGTLPVEQLKTNVLNEVVGLGPLERFIEDDTITEIMVNGCQEIFVERQGIIEKSPYSFSSDDAVYAVIDRIITPLGRRVDENSPIVDARLKDGSRVNAVIPPLALKGPTLTVRKFPKHNLTISDLADYGSINAAMAEFLRLCVTLRKNIVVSGGTGSGKTTLLNALSQFIPSAERIVTIEDAAELKLVQPNLVSLESRPPNLEGVGEISIRDLVRNSLRMRPDRIVVGECRGGEAIDMLQAMNTGHDGSLTTVHANNPRDVISRLEVLVLMAGMDLPVQAIREQIASAVNIIVQQTRFPCGTRKITKITEVVGMESGTVQLQDIFEFRQTGVSQQGAMTGTFRSTESIPAFYEELLAQGISLDHSLFTRADSANTTRNAQQSVPTSDTAKKTTVNDRAIQNNQTLPQHGQRATQ